MGIDLLDITFRVEKETGIRISQDDWASLHRDGEILVADVYSLLLARKHFSQDIRSSMELNETVWVGVQHSLAEACGLNAESIRLDSDLATLIPEARRKSVWQRFVALSPFHPPMLVLHPRDERRRGLEMIAELAGVMLLSSIPVGIAFAYGGSGSFFANLVAGIAGAVMSGFIVSALVSRREQRYWSARRVHFSKGLTNVKELCRRVRDTNITRLIPGISTSELDDGLVLWQKLQTCLVDALGVDDDEVTLRAGFFRDLGVE